MARVLRRMARSYGGSLSGPERARGPMTRPLQNAFCVAFLASSLACSSASDDDEVSELQQTIIRLEAENKISNSGIDSSEGGFFSSLRWEWFVIGLLVVMLIFVLRNRKMVLPDN